MMKKTLLFILLAGFMLPLQAQPDAKNEVREALDTYFKTTVDKDVDGMLDMIYPKLYEKATREQIKAAFDALNNSPLYDVKFQDLKVGGLGEVLSEGDERFCKVNYSFVMGFTMQTEDPGTIDQFGNALKTQLGAEKVSWDEDANTYWVANITNMVAIAGPTYEGWKFIELKPEMQSLNLIPESVLQRME